jgi:lipopolysaccharide/colanic/teichoic acid biosynthesis glycosyltransferase
MATTLHPYYFSQTKRTFDIVLAVVFLSLSLPVWSILIPVVFLTIGKPVFFKQRRAGLHKKAFTMYKFRTMQKNASLTKKTYKYLNQAPEPMFKIFDDPRFVGIGKFLSKTGLDETPQFINILRGEMSFVGPRPLPLSEVRKLHPSWKFRSQVKPGLFSEWTLSEKRHESLNSWKKLDQKTLSHGGIFYDLKLIVKTLFKTIKTS